MKRWIVLMGVEAILWLALMALIFNAKELTSYGVTVYGAEPFINMLLQASIVLTFLSVVLSAIYLKALNYRYSNFDEFMDIIVLLSMPWLLLIANATLMLISLNLAEQTKITTNTPSTILTTNIIIAVALALPTIRLLLTQKTK